MFALERLGRRVTAYLAEWGYYGALVAESLYWLVVGPAKNQPVRLRETVSQMMQIGIAAIPIVFMLSFAVGVMLAIQGIHTLKVFGAESKIVVGVALSVTREFAPLITAIVVAGRSGSALAARIGTMTVTQEIDALHVMSINAIRYLVAPVLVAMVIMVPALAFMADFAALLGAAIFSSLELGMSVEAYALETIRVLTISDVAQGIAKSVVFAVIIALVGVSNGFSVSGGAEGVGKGTTRAVVLSIVYIVLADMLFTWMLNR